VTNPTSPPRILAIGGSTTPLSATERALRIAGAECRSSGAEVTYLTGRALMLPIYDTEASDRDPSAQAVVDAFRAADGIIIASPGYHGSISGMLKNVLDYVEDLRRDERPYLDGRAVGLIAVAHGWQTAVGTLQHLRQVVHSLRGWPTPLGVAINDAAGLIGSGADDSDPHVVEQLQAMADQVTRMAALLRG